MTFFSTYFWNIRGAKLSYSPHSFGQRAGAGVSFERAEVMLQAGDEGNVTYGLRG